MTNTSGKLRVTKRDSPYINIDKTSINDKELSWGAKGLFAYILGLPPNWIIYISELSNHSTVGYTGTVSLLDELIRAGYIKREVLRNDKGHFGGYDYECFERPLPIEERPILKEKYKRPKKEAPIEVIAEHGNSIIGSAELGESFAKDYTQEQISIKVNNEVEGAIAPQTTSPPSKKENSFNWNLIKGNLTAEQADAAIRDLLSDPPTRAKIIQTAMWNGTEEDLQAFIPKFCSRAIEQYGKKIQSKYSLITELEIWLGKEKHFASSEAHRFNAEQFKSHYDLYVSKIEKLSPETKQELSKKREVWSKYIEEQFLPKLNSYKFLSTYDGLNTQDFAYLAVKYNKGAHFKIVLECIETIENTKKYVSFRRLKEAIDKAYEDATKPK